MKDIPVDLTLARKYSWEQSGYICTDIIQHTESQEYSAYTFLLKNKSVIFRIAKITPTKIGQFVTLWVRSEKGPIIPYHENDIIDLVIVLVRADEKLGQFIFPKEVLIQKGIISQAKKIGKLAMRVYPPWDVTDNLQAKRTQKWQLEYFVEIDTQEKASEKNKERTVLLLMQ